MQEYLFSKVKNRVVLSLCLDRSYSFWCGQWCGLFKSLTAGFFLCVCGTLLDIQSSSSNSDLSDIRCVWACADLAAMYNMWLMRNILWKSRPRRSVSLSWSKPWKPGYWYDSEHKQRLNISLGNVHIRIYRCFYTVWDHSVPDYLFGLIQICKCVELWILKHNRNEQYFLDLIFPLVHIQTNHVLVRQHLLISCLELTAHSSQPTTSYICMLNCIKPWNCPIFLRR